MAESHSHKRSRIRSLYDRPLQIGYSPVCHSIQIEIQRADSIEQMSKRYALLTVLNVWSLSSHTLGSLQGIDLPVSAFGLYLQMGGHVAVPHTPLGSGIREDEAIFAGRKFLGPHAAFTLINNCVAGATIKLTACLAHKRAANTRFYACTVHFNHVLSRPYQRSPLFVIIEKF